MTAFGFRREILVFLNVSVTHNGTLWLVFSLSTHLLILFDTLPLPLTGLHRLIPSQASSTLHALGREFQATFIGLPDVGSLLLSDHVACTIAVPFLRCWRQG